MFLEKKANFWGNKTVDQRSGANLTKRVLGKILLQISCFFAQKTLKMTISTSVWSAQHPNAGPNIQQQGTTLIKIKLLFIQALHVNFDYSGSYFRKQILTK